MKVISHFKDNGEKLTTIIAELLKEYLKNK